MDPLLLKLVAAGLVIAVGVVVYLFTAKKSKPFLNKQEQQVKLIERTELSHDTLRLRFGLPDKNQCLGLPVGKHIKVMGPNMTGVVDGQWNGREDPEAKEARIIRSYTPTSSDDDLGFVDLVVKVYEAGVKERFPDGGKMSQYLSKIKVGESVAIRGPTGLVEYKGLGVFQQSKRVLAAKKHVGMMAGGTGITPMLQIIAAILKDPKDTTKISLIFANQKEEDILVRDMLEALEKKHSDRFHLWYTLDFPEENWKYSKGFINVDMIKEHLPAPGPDTVILMCGPPPMIKYACKANLDTLGYHKEDQLAF